MGIVLKTSNMFPYRPSRTISTIELPVDILIIHLTEDIIQNITVQFKEQTGRNGEYRYYTQNLPEVIGLEVEYHKPGNVSSAKPASDPLSYAQLNGKPLSHARAWELFNLDTYLDDEGNVHVLTYGRTPRALSLDAIRQRITHAWQLA